MRKNLSFGDRIKIALVRDLLTLSQDVDLDKFNNSASLPAYDDVEEQLNIPYMMEREEVPLAMDVFKPLKPAGQKLPVVVTIHGGGLTMGNRKLSRPFSRLLAHKGYLVFSLEYRLVPQVNVCQEIDDLCSGLDKMAHMLPDYDVDYDRIFMAAESAGAYLGMYLTAFAFSEKLQKAVGFTPERIDFKFAAIGLMSGMIYTNRNDPCGWVLCDQIYGDMRMDDEFLKLMNPECSDILDNLPPTYLITSRGDFVNHYSVMYNDALKKAGKPCHLLYYGDINLQHAFTTMQLDNPRSVEAIEKMLAWFEDQATAGKTKDKRAEDASKVANAQREKMVDGTMDDQPIWRYVQERSNADPDRMTAPAVIDCTRTYTYAQMFDMWEKYARAFSALHMTGADKARVGIAGAIAAEPLFAFYALNMTGAEVSMFSYPDFLPGGRWQAMVEKEHITDLVITDIMVTPQMWQEIKTVGESLGLRNIILMHSLMGGPCVGPAELTFNEFNYHALKRIPGTVFMDDLVKEHADEPVAYGDNSGDRIALITHTSGSTNGTRKPLPYTNRSVNAVASALPDGYNAQFKDRMPVGRRPRIALTYDMSSFANIGGLANMNLSTGNTLVLTFFGFMHPKFVQAIPYYQLDMLLASNFMMESWMKQPHIEENDFSSLKVLGIGGSFLSLEKLAEYKKFLKSQGFRYDVTRGYGMSEIGGAELFVPADCTDDILGYPMPPEDYYVLDDADGKFHCVTEGERTGVMYVTSKSMCANVLDGVELFPLTEIDGRQFVCTNDKVVVNADGSLSYAGRMDKFFVNNEGVRFDAGIVEKKIGELACVSQLALVPMLDKRIHDTVPVLYVEPADKNAGIVEQVAAQLEKAYAEEAELVGTALPSQLVIVDSIPCTATAKVDTYRISRERCAGETYNIVPTYSADGDLQSVRMTAEDNVSTIKAGSLPQGMGGDSALGLFEAFNDESAEMLRPKDIKNALKSAREQDKDMQTTVADYLKDSIFSLIPEDVAKKYGFENGHMGTPSQEVSNKFMELQGMLYGHDTIAHDFED